MKEWFLLKFKSGQGRCICRPSLDLRLIGDTRKVIVNILHLFFRWLSGLDGLLPGNVRQWIHPLPMMIRLGHPAHSLRILRIVRIHISHTVARMGLCLWSWLRMIRFVIEFILFYCSFIWLLFPYYRWYELGWV